MERKRPIRIGNVSGAVGDRIDAMQKMLSGDVKVDAITGDWLSEINIAWKAAEYSQNPTKGYEGSFLDSLKRCSPQKLENSGLKIAVNAGGLNPKALAEATAGYLHTVGSNLVVAWIEGDNVKQQIVGGMQNTLSHLTRPGEYLRVDSSVQCALAYTGGWAITEALKNGADIVIAGRCTDASPVIALAAWWHDWRTEDWDFLAGALVAGHLIECGPYVTGGNYPGFKVYIDSYLDLAHPIACIEHDGSCTIMKAPKSAGLLTLDTVKNQLVYEIQGRYYLNTDVVADLENLKMMSKGESAVYVSGVTGLPPPPTTKVAVYRQGGYQCETMIYVFGLDTTEKARSWEAMVRNQIDVSKFQVLDFQLLGSCATDPQTQNEATTVLRLFAQAEDVSTLDFSQFYGTIMSNGMQAFPAFTPSLNHGAVLPKPYSQYFPGLFPTAQLSMNVHLLGGKVFTVPAAKTFSAPSTLVQPTSETARPRELHTFGPTVQIPLGRAVYARSGDKGSNINIGIFFPQLPEGGHCIDRDEVQEEKWQWIQSFMTVERLIKLIGPRQRSDQSLRVERYELAHLRAVNFVIFDVLDEGASSTRYVDVLGKGFAEYIRARVVEMPYKFLATGPDTKSHAQLSLQPVELV